MPANGYSEIRQRIDDVMTSDEYNLEDTKVSHVENLFIISYLTKALQDLLIKRSKLWQYPLLLVDLPLAMAIFIVNLERIIYVKILGYVLAHIRYDVDVFKGLVMQKDKEDKAEDWQEWAFNGIRKLMRFLWGMVILMMVLPVWPLIWLYNHVAQTVLIAIIYYFLMYGGFAYPAGWLVYYLLLATVTFLVSSITVPFIFRISVYVRELFSLEKKPWKQVHAEAKTAFVKFYQRLHGDHAKAMKDIKVRYDDGYKAEGGVYYMLLKFLHYFKNKFWTLKEKKMDAVVEKIQDKTVEFVDEYYEERYTYYFTLQQLSTKDLRRTLLALGLTIVFSVSLALHGSNGEGVIGPILLSFVEQPVSEQIWINYQGQGIGYYESMVLSYMVLPNLLKYVAMGADQVLFFAFQAYYLSYPVYVNALAVYYGFLLNFFLSGIFYNFW